MIKYTPSSRAITPRTHSYPLNPRNPYFLGGIPLRSTLPLLTCLLGFHTAKRHSVRQPPLQSLARTPNLKPHITSKLGLVTRKHDHANRISCPPHHITRHYHSSPMQAAPCKRHLAGCRASCHLNVTPKSIAREAFAGCTWQMPHVQAGPCTAASCKRPACTGPPSPSPHLANGNRTCGTLPSAPCTHCN